jgi:hypothetical protein
MQRLFLRRCGILNRVDSIASVRKGKILATITTTQQALTNVKFGLAEAETTLYFTSSDMARVTAMSTGRRYKCRNCGRALARDVSANVRKRPRWMRMQSHH